MAPPIDFSGIALVIGAMGVLLASVGTFIVQMVALTRQAAIKQDTDRKLDALHDQGNSNLATARALSEALGVEKGRQIGASDSARAAGKQEGIEEERAKPMIPAPQPIVVTMPEQESPLPVTVVEPDGTPAKKDKPRS